MDEVCGEEENYEWKELQMIFSTAHMLDIATKYSFEIKIKIRWKFVKKLERWEQNRTGPRKTH